MQVKRILNENHGHPERMSLDGSLFQREGMTAFTEKRAPRWVPKALTTGKRV